MDWEKRFPPGDFDGLTEEDFFTAVRHIENGPWKDNEAYKEKRFDGLKLCYLILDCFRFDQVQDYNQFEKALKKAKELVESRKSLKLPSLYELDWKGLTRADYVQVYSQITEPKGEGREQYWTLQMCYDAMFLIVIHPGIGSFSTMGTMEEVACRLKEVHQILTKRLEVSRLCTESGAK